MSKSVSPPGLTTRFLARPGALVSLLLAWSLACGSGGSESDSPSEEPGQTQQVLTNGSFETGPTSGARESFVTLSAGSHALPGWNISGGGVDYILNQWPGAEGSRSLDLSALSEGSIFQTLGDLKPGVVYTVHFWMAGNTDCGPTVKQLRVETEEKGKDFTFDTTGHSASNMGWIRYSFDFTSTTPNNTLMFRSLTSSRCGPALDGIELNTHR